jgi:hypothetical protein
MRTVGTDHDDRHAIAPRAVESHRGVHQADIGVHDGEHRLTGDLRITVRDRDGVLFVQTHEHVRIVRIEIIHEAIV